MVLARGADSENIPCRRVCNKHCVLLCALSRRRIESAVGSRWPDQDLANVRGYDLPSLPVRILSGCDLKPVGAEYRTSV